MADTRTEQTSAQPSRPAGPQWRPAGQSKVAASITRGILGGLVGIAEEVQAAAVFVYVNAIGMEQFELLDRLADKLILVSELSYKSLPALYGARRAVHVPDVPLTRGGQMNIAIFAALSQGLVKSGDVVVFAGGNAEAALSSITVVQIGPEFELFASLRQNDQPSRIQAEVLERAVDVAVELGGEGREGKPVGALFVVGDAARVLELSRPLILNPFQGHPEDQRNLLDPALEETIKELSTIDGAFIIRGDGIVEAAGAFLAARSETVVELPQGLGARHQAAAAITAATGAVAITVSESTGTVMIFRGGVPVLEIEKPRSAGRHRRRFGGSRWRA